MCKVYDLKISQRRDSIKTSWAILGKVKISKAVPLRHVGAKGGEAYSSYSLMTSALDGVSGQLHAPAAFYLLG
jgi:hypothetical protein